MNPNDKLHHHLIVGEIIFKEEGSEAIASLRVNGVLMDPKQEVPVRLLGKAQQILQMNFYQRMGEQRVTVLDVILMNVVYLGHMTQEEFHQPPEGTKLQQKSEGPVLVAVPDLEQAVAEAETGSSNDASANPE